MRKYWFYGAFQSAFRRAERQLTGRKYGLAWFYDEGIRGQDYSAMRPGPFEVMRVLYRHRGAQRLEMEVAQVAPLEQAYARLLVQQGFDLEAWAKSEGMYYDLEWDDDDFEVMASESGVGPEDWTDPGIGTTRVDE